MTHACSDPSLPCMNNTVKSTAPPVEMIRLLVATVLFVSVTCCNPVLKPGWGLGPDECQLALAPTYTEQQLQKNAVTACIAKQPGLQAIIDSLRFPFNGRDGSRHLFFGLKCKDIATLLETNGRPDEATTLRECTAGERGMVNGNGTYDMDALKTDILTKVTGLPILPNVQRGLDGCPVVEAFDVAKYMRCITTYCKTGAAP